MTKYKIQSQIALFVVSLIFGANYIISKTLMPVYINPYQLLVLRAGGAMVLIWIFQLFTEKEKVSSKDLWLLALCSFFGIALNQGLFYLGLNLTSAIDASILHTANPVFVMIFAAFIIKEKVSLLKTTGILFGMMGALLIIITANHPLHGNSTYAGNILILINGASYALYLVLIKPFMLKYKPITVLKWVFLFGFIFTIPFGNASLFSIKWELFGMTQYLLLIYIIVVNSFIAYLLIVFALKHVTATVAGYYAYLQPLVASIIGIVTATEVLSWLKIFSGILIFTGVYLVNKNRLNIPKK
ncbi:MAG: EamA family transporter [Bacteroidetes bacterium]|nr:EamA family transporter [Bacteroidota bacterium]